jgi:hypothetical protein
MIAGCRMRMLRKIIELDHTRDAVPLVVSTIFRSVFLHSESDISWRLGRNNAVGHKRGICTGHTHLTFHFMLTWSFVHDDRGHIAVTLRIFTKRPSDCSYTELEMLLFCIAIISRLNHFYVRNGGDATSLFHVYTVLACESVPKVSIADTPLVSGCADNHPAPTGDSAYEEAGQICVL